MSLFSRPTFACINQSCGRASGFVQRARALLMEARVAPLHGASETRTYECEHCGTEQPITKTSREWHEIDQAPPIA